MVAIKAKPHEVTDALHVLRVPYGVLEFAIVQGEIARDSCTKNDPRYAAGFDAWARSVRALRDGLVPKGWTAHDDRNYPTVVNPPKTLAIAVATGDEGTGLADRTPDTKYAKGIAARQAVNINQAVLFPELKPSEAEIAAADCVTWILLKRRERDRVFAEVSLPYAMTKDGRVQSWQTRIILKPILISPAITIQQDTTEAVDVRVKRRQAN